jgi:hypothetical protein
MSSRTRETRSQSNRHTSNLAWWMISFMHDKPLPPIFRNPYKLLEAAGLKPGQEPRLLIAPALVKTIIQAWPKGNTAGKYSAVSFQQIPLF